MLVDEDPLNMGISTGCFRCPMQRCRGTLYQACFSAFVKLQIELVGAGFAEPVVMDDFTDVFVGALFHFIEHAGAEIDQFFIAFAIAARIDHDFVSHLWPIEAEMPTAMQHAASPFSVMSITHSSRDHEIGLRAGIHLLLDNRLRIFRAILDENAFNRALFPAVSMRPELIQTVELLQSPDPETIDQAIQLLQNTVFSFSMKVCGHREDAEDTMQDVLLKSLPYLRKIQSPQALAVWLYRVTRNRCWMSRRKSKFAPQQMLSLEELMPSEAELASLAAKPSSTPEANAIQHQDAEQLRKAILRVPPNYRLILVLHDMEDLSGAEVAKITGLQEGTVRVRLHRARLLVRQELAAGYTENKRKKKTKRVASIDCKRIFAGLSDYLDGVVDDLSCEKLQKHIESCAPCIQFLEDLSRTVQRCRSHEAKCKPETADRVRKLLVQEYLRLSA